MALILDHAIQFGNEKFEFGVRDPNALTLIDGCAVESIELKGEPEVYATAKDAQGNTAAVVVSQPNKYKLTATVSGYVVDKALFNAVSNFTFQGRFYIIKSRSQTSNNEDFARCNIEAESFFLINNTPAPATP
jgi:hypothetical protein